RTSDTAAAESVLAPPQLLEQLEELGRRGRAGAHPAVLLSANYEAQSATDRVNFFASYRVHSFSSETTTITIPIGDALLRAARCNGVDIHPTAVRLPREGYSFEIKGAGDHELVLEFSVRVHEQGGQYEMRCSIPELVQSHLKFKVPPGSRALYAVA